MSGPMLGPGYAQAQIDTVLAGGDTPTATADEALSVSKSPRGTLERPAASEPSPLGQAALEYARRGWPVFPCEPRGKKPLTEHGLKDATTDDRTIRDWWMRWPDANIGHPTGNLIVLDVDGPEGARTLAELEAKHGKLPATLTAKTGKGRHLYFEPNGAQIRNSAGKLGAGLDVRGTGGYVILPPSIHESGRRYEWLR